jgi:hypothetical protein
MLSETRILNRELYPLLAQRGSSSRHPSKEALMPACVSSWSVSEEAPMPPRTAHHDKSTSNALFLLEQDPSLKPKAREWISSAQRELSRAFAASRQTPLVHPQKPDKSQLLREGG